MSPEVGVPPEGLFCLGRGVPRGSSTSAAGVAAAADDVDVLQADGQTLGFADPGFGGVVAGQVLGRVAVRAPGLKTSSALGELHPGCVVAATVGGRGLAAGESVLVATLVGGGLTADDAGLPGHRVVTFRLLRAA